MPAHGAYHATLREGNFTRSSLDVVEEINIFTGKENRLTFQQVFAKTFMCKYQLQLYPFDTQVMVLWDISVL